MSLPHAVNAHVPKTKCTQYLLDINHADGKSKAGFFISHGYTLIQWYRLADDLRLHGQTHPVSTQRATVGGTNYSIIGPLTMPDGVTKKVKTVWYIETNGAQPSLVSAYPTR